MRFPPDMPKALGLAVKINVFIDASHASNAVTPPQSRTGVLWYVNGALIIWHSKKQNSVETISSFGSEFTALKQGVELLEGLRSYKLQMMGCSK